MEMKLKSSLRLKKPGKPKAPAKLKPVKLKSAKIKFPKIKRAPKPII